MRSANDLSEDDPLLASDERCRTEVAPGTNEDSCTAACRLGAPVSIVLSADVSEAGEISLQLAHAPGALRAVLGARRDADDVTPTAFAAQAIHDLVQLTLAGKKPSPGPADMTAANAVLQAVAAFEPTDEVEGMLALQAAAFHHVTIDCLARSLRADRTEVRSANLGQANKCARTFATLVETLNRHRGKCTTQRVIVENVTVEAGGQAVVGAVQGAGATKKEGIQAHGYTNEKSSAGGARSGARHAALLGPQSIGQSVSTTGEQGEKALPHARRRSRKRCAEGQQEPLDARPLQRGRDRFPQGGRGHLEGGATDRRVANNNRQHDGG